MKVDPKSIVRRLSALCTSHLEGAVGRAAGGQFYEIVPEHLLALGGGGYNLSNIAAVCNNVVQALVEA